MAEMLAATVGLRFHLSEYWGPGHHSAAVCPPAVADRSGGMHVYPSSSVRDAAPSAPSPSAQIADSAPAGLAAPVHIPAVVFDLVGRKAVARTPAGRRVVAWLVDYLLVADRELAVSGNTSVAIARAGQLVRMVKALLEVASRTVCVLRSVVHLSVFRMARHSGRRSGRTCVPDGGAQSYCTCRCTYASLAVKRFGYADRCIPELYLPIPESLGYNTLSLCQQ
jgi:hypothetical protein